MVKAGLIAIAITFFGGFGMLGYCSRQDKAKEEERNRAATVNGTEITITEVTQIAESRRARQTQPMTDAEWVKAREDVLDSLINMELVYEEARRLGIQATDDEVQKNIMQAFQAEGVFQPDLYRSFLQKQGFTEEVFEDRLRREIIIRKALHIVGGAVVVTDDDVSQYYKYENEETNLDLLIVDPESITDVAQPTTTEIKLRYDKSEEGYTVPEKRQIKFACFNVSQFARSSEVTDADIQKFYDTTKNFRFATVHRKVHVKHIFFSMDPQDTDENKNKIKDKARQVASDAKLGTSPFDNLASLYSDDQETKNKGGDLGWFELSTKNVDITRAVQSLKAGEISDIVQDEKGLNIYKVEEDQPGVYKSLSQVRREIIEIMQKGRGPQLAKKAAKGMLETIRDGKTFDEAAKAATVEAHLSPFFDAAAKSIEGLPAPNEKIAEATFKLYQENQVSDVIDVENGSCIAQIAKIEDKHEASYEEAIPMIKAEILGKERNKKAKEIAEALLKKIEGGMPFETAARQSGMTVVNTGYFARVRAQVPSAGYSEDMITAAFSLPIHDPVAKKVFEAGGKYYLLKVNGRKDADPAGFDKEKLSWRLRLTVKRQNELSESWIATLKDRATITKKSFAPEAGQGQ